MCVEWGKTTTEGKRIRSLVLAMLSFRWLPDITYTEYRVENIGSEFRGRGLVEKPERHDLKDGI